MSEPLKPIKWVKDEALEYLLKEPKLDWGIEDVRLNDINLEESKKRQSRLDRAWDEDRSLNISVNMEAGFPIPMICVYKVKGVGLIVPAGLHRTFGAKIYVNDRDNQYKIKAYVIRNGDVKYITDVLPSLTNASEGQGLTFEQRRARAADLVVSDGFPMEQVARQFGLILTTLEKYVAGLKITDRLISLGVNISKSLTKSTVVEALRGLSHNDNVLKAAATMMSENDIGTEDAKSIVRDVKKIRNEGQALLAIAEAHRDIKSRGTPERAWSQSPRRSLLLRNCTQLIEHLKQYDNFESLQVTVPEDRSIVEEKVRDLLFRLQNLIDGVVEKRKRA